MRLTATDKAIGELNMQKADIERAARYVADGVDFHAAATDIDRCIEILRSVSTAVVAKKAAKSEKPKRVRKSKKADEDSE